MRYFQSEHNFQKYKPYKRKKFFLFRKRKLKSNAFPSKRLVKPNPFKKEKKDYRFLTRIIILVSVLVFWLGVIIYLPFFRVDKVLYNGLNIIKQSEIEEVLNKKITGWFIYPKNNYFLLNEKKLEKLIMENFSVNSIEVEKKFPDELRVRIEEKISSVIYDDGKKYYLLDQEGSVLKELVDVGEAEFVFESAIGSEEVDSEGEGAVTSTIITKIHVPDYKKIQRDHGSYPVIYDKTIVEEGNGRLDSEVIEAAILWEEKMREFELLRIKYFVFENKNTGLLVVSNMAWDLHIPLNRVEGAFENLELTLKENNPVEYIDLRYGDRVYWK